MLKTKEAKPERNTGRKLTIPVTCRTPLQAFQMLRMGHPIDVQAGYYDEQGILEPDFYMMDQIGKLSALAKYKEQLYETKQQIDQVFDKEIEDRKAAKHKAEIEEAAKELLTKQQQINEQQQQQQQNP